MSNPKVALNVAFPSDPTAVAKYLLPNKTVTGALIGVNWSSIDNGKSYNFASVDQQIATWTKAGKVANLVIWAVSDSGSGQYGNASTPQYIWDGLGPENYTTLDTQAGSQRIPNYFDEFYQQRWQLFIQNLAVHCRGKVGYIRPGLGHGGETIPGAGWQNSPAFKQWGVTVETWMAYLNNCLEYLGEFKGIDWAVGITPMGSPSTQVPDFLAGVAASLGFQFGSQGLELSDLTAKVTTANWLGNFAKYPNVRHELQTIAASCPQNNCPTGSLVELVPFAVKNGCDVLELYCSDWMIAYDPANPLYAEYGKQYATVLESVNG
ncbi:MAG TPA: hypothetical protein VN861_03365 [Candidatus Acidoferrales bacterium]|nr:hypothetical protein [Candidatus Acidoferrales bacterium]